MQTAYTTSVAAAVPDALSEDPLVTYPQMASRGMVPVAGAAGGYAASAGPSPSGPIEPLCPYGHQGLRHDRTTGLVYNRARMLSPALGRSEK
jgi:hypothetical protein